MKNLNQKLLKFQANVEAVKKDSKNPHFKSSYFDINSLLAAIMPELNAVGLILTQKVNTTEAGRMHLITEIICAESSETLSSTMLLPEVGKPQDYGSALTYMRRYSLQALLGIQAEDDDGNVASGPAPQRTTSFSKFGGKQ